MGALLKLVVTAVVAIVAAIAGPSGPRELPGWTSGSLIVNGGAEHSAAAGSESQIVRPDGWSTVGRFTAVRYGVEGLPSKLEGAAIGGGAHLFAGGPQNHSSAAIQVAAIPQRWRLLVRQGRVYAKVFASLGGWQTRPDSATVSVRFIDASGTVWGRVLRLPPVTVAERRNVTAFLPASATRKVPPQTRYVRIRIDAVGTSGPYNTGFADNLALYLVR
jgi:hypothetical protein